MRDGFWLALDDTLAPQGYAYLLVMGGRGTVKSCMFADFGGQRRYVARTVERFRRLAGLEMREPRFHAGAGNIHLPDSALAGGLRLAGECAGFQDGLAGFGMRYAMRSGVLAARALLDGEHYDALWQREMAGAMGASIVNRTLFGMLGNAGYRWLLRVQAASGDTRAFLRWLYAPGWLWRGLLPWARQRYRSRLEEARLHGQTS
jgi:flavin-dependent dehydrogenase